MKKTIYFRQVELLLKILPLVAAEKEFALKGGTAINFFIRDLPRLSVDIDLTFIPIGERDEALIAITRSMNAIASKVQHAFPKSRIVKKKIGGTENIRGMVVNLDGITIKIEPNSVIRGSVYPPEEMVLSDVVQSMFGMYFVVKTLSFADLYAGKICAALDRQHPRDLFDIHLLLSNEGLSENVRKAFIVYLISHPRPMIELLNPNFKDISDIFFNEFEGMTRDKVFYEDLLNTRESLVKAVRLSLNDSDKSFLLSFKKGTPDWSFLELNHIHKLPAVRWKLINIQKMSSKKHIEAIKKIEAFLQL